MKCNKQNISMLLKNDVPINDIIKIFGFSKITFHRRLKEFGLNNILNSKANYLLFKHEKKSVYKDFISLNIKEICKKYNCSKFVVKQVCYKIKVDCNLVNGLTKKTITHHNKLSFEQAKKNISSKYTYLELLSFTDRLSVCKVLDKEYGEFVGQYESIYYGKKKHPDRVKVNIINAANKPAKLYKIKKTNIKRYGTEVPFKNAKIKEKIKKTCLEKYGCENPSQNQNIKNKKIETSLKNYNTNHPLQSKIIKNKIKNTNLKKYGTSCTLQFRDIKEKSKITNIKKYGTKHPSQSQEIKEKVKQTNLKKFGFEFPAQNKNIKNKIKSSNIENGNWHNINGYTLKDYYNNSKLSNIRSYTSVQQCYNKDGCQALELNYYDKLTGKSRVANKWLNEIEKQIGYSLIREYHISGTLFHADGYDPNTNTIYEFYGDFWHGNLKKFAAEEINPITKTNFKDLYDKTMKRQNKIKNLGYNVVYTWESTFNVSACN